MLLPLLLIAVISIANAADNCNSTINVNATTASSSLVPSPGSIARTCAYTFNFTHGFVPLYFTLRSLTLNEGDSLAFYNGTINDILLIKKYVGAAHTFFDFSSNLNIIFSIAPNTTIVYTQANNDSTSRFQVDYKVNECAVDLSNPSAPLTFWTPLYASAHTTQVKCSYTMNSTDPLYKIALSFSQVNVTEGTVTINRDALKGKVYSLPDFIYSNITVEVEFQASSLSMFVGHITHVNADCSGHYSADQFKLVPIPETNGGLYCYGVVNSSNGKNMRVDLVTHQLGEHDLLELKDGDSYNSPTLYYNLLDEVPSVITSGQSVVYHFYGDVLSSETRNLKANISELELGGRYTSPGPLSIFTKLWTGSAIYLQFDTLKTGDQVLLAVVNQSLPKQALMKCYSGESMSAPLVAVITSDSLHEVFSDHSLLLCVIQNHTTVNESINIRVNFTTFTGDYMVNMVDSSGVLKLESQANIDTKNMTWFIHTYQTTGVVRLWSSEMTLLPTCSITIHQGLTANGKLLATTNSSQFMFPVIYITPGSGIRVDYTCTTASNKSVAEILYQAYYSSIEDCTMDLNESLGELATPLYPDHYPFNAQCTWKIKVPVKKSLHLWFNKVQLASNDTVNITWLDGDKTAYATVNGTNLPVDMVVTPNGTVSVLFSSVSAQPLTTFDVGFFNAKYEIVDCGGTYSMEKGSFFTEARPTEGTKCAWIVHVPSKTTPRLGSLVNYTMTLTNFKNESRSALKLLDGHTAADEEYNLTLRNGQMPADLSYRDTLLFSLKFNGSQPTFALLVNYTTYTCTQACDNGLCMHPDWICNGANDCGDNSDEVLPQCNRTVIIHNSTVVVTKDGVSKAALGIGICIAFIVGIIIAMIAPAIYRKIRYRRYSEFQNPNVTA